MPGKPISLLGDHHACPAVNPGPVPHVGGPVVNPGQSIVRIAGRPVAVVGGSTLCSGVPCTDAIVAGSPVLRITGKPVARVGDSTSHGGSLVAGNSFVRAS